MQTTIIAQTIAGNAPRFAQTSCSQCGRDTGPGDSGHSSCATHQLATAPDLSGLYDYEFESSLGLCLRCYLEHEPAEPQTHWEPGCSEKIELVYAFAGLIDVSEVLSDDVKALIEEKALADLHQRAQDSCDDARIDAYIDRMECEA